MPPRVLTLEGDDACGKGTTTNGIIALALENTDRTIGFASHPNYHASGQFIKGMNRGLADQVLNPLPALENVAYRCAAFALDRLFTLAMLLPLHRRDPQSLLVFDRGPHSNAVTVGYMIANGIISQQDVPYFRDTIIPDVDQEILSTLNPFPILCETTDGENGFVTGEREALDNYEKLSDRTPIAEVYHQIITTPSHITRRGDTWVPVYEQATIILQNYLQIDVNKIPLRNPSQVLRAGRHCQRLIVAGPDVFLKMLFGNDITHIIANHHQLSSSMSYWFTVLTSDPSNQNAGDRQLDQLEKQIAHSILGIMREYSMPNPNLPQEVIMGMNRLMASYPRLWDIIDLTLDKYASSFSNFIENIIYLNRES